jgi:protein-arginine kinase/protein-arginine kinase activator protein McsA
MPSTIFENVICGQCREREAVVFIRRSGGGGSSGDSALCESCARSRGIAAGKGLLELSLDDLIGGGAELGTAQARSRACPSCGLELAALKRDGRLGCSSCADAFRPEIIRALGPGRAVESARSAPAEPRAASSGGEGSPKDSRAASELGRRLSEALSAEDYEAAAVLRDRLAGISDGIPPPPAAGASAFLDDAASLVDDRAPESDVILWTSASLRRDVEGRPFPGSAGASSASNPILAGRFPASEGWLVRTMSELGSCGRRSLAERGLAPRDFAAVDGAVIAARDADCAYALLDEGDHLSARALRPGFDPGGVLGAALAVADRLGREVEFASRPGIGWICSRVADCGRGYSLSAAVHLPALAATGLLDRLFKALMSEGASIRGLYSSSEGSAGSLYEIMIEASSPTGDPLGALGAAATAAASAERRARGELAEKSRDALLDSEGRAYGIVRHCRLLGAEEGASLVSSLRLAALRGVLKGVGPAALAALLASLGPGSLGKAAGMGSPPAAEGQDILRATVVKAALKDAEYRPEEAS